MPPKSCEVNTAWCHAVSIATDLLSAWLKLLGLTADLAKAPNQSAALPRRAGAARLPRGQRHRWLRPPKTWPWSTALADAIAQIR